MANTDNNNNIPNIDVLTSLNQLLQQKFPQKNIRISYSTKIGNQNTPQSSTSNTENNKLQYDLFDLYNQTAPPEPQPVNRDIEKAKKFGAIVSAGTASLLNLISSLSPRTLASYNAQPYIADYINIKRQNDLLDRQAKMLYDQQKAAFERGKIPLLMSTFKAQKPVNKQDVEDALSLTIGDKTQTSSGRTPTKKVTTTVNVGEIPIPINYASLILNKMLEIDPKLYNDIYTNDAAIRSLIGSTDYTMRSEGFTRFINKFMEKMPEIEKNKIKNVATDIYKQMSDVYIMPKINLPNQQNTQQTTTNQNNVIEKPKIIGM